MRSKQNLFSQISDGIWKIKYLNLHPLAATLREFTQAEKQDKMNYGMQGVRTFYF